MASIPMTIPSPPLPRRVIGRMTPPAPPRDRSCQYAAKHGTGSLSEDAQKSDDAPPAHHWCNGDDANAAAALQALDEQACRDDVSYQDLVISQLRITVKCPSISI